MYIMQIDISKKNCRSLTEMDQQLVSCAQFIWLVIVLINHVQLCQKWKSENFAIHSIFRTG